MSFIEELSISGYERVVRISDPAVDLLAIIAIHDKTLGPSLGGIRIFPYNSFPDALQDVLRLAEGMTRKSAMADTGLGGAKGVVIGNSAKGMIKKETLLRFGEAINLLQGAYIGAEDMGCTTKELAILSQKTKYLTGLDHEQSSGNPAPFTAFGTFRGLEAICMYLYKTPSLQGIKIAVQGLGNVGLHLVYRLYWAGADIIISDIDEIKAQKLAKQLGAKYVPAEEVLFQECDILSPCAVGGILNENTIPHLRCKAIGGCANNQLLLEVDAARLAKRNILYAPDFIINAGGLINVASEILPEKYNPTLARKNVNQIYERLLGIFFISEKNGVTPNQTASALAAYRIKYKIGLRKEAPCFHHAELQNCLV